MAWHATVKTLDDDSVLTRNLQNVLMKEIEASKCSKVLGSGNNGRVQKVCQNECKTCEVLKVSLSEEGVNLAEAMILKEITQKVPDRDPQSRHILRYIRSFRASDGADYEQPVWLFTNQVPFAKYKNLDDYLSKISVKELQYMLFQIFATMAHITVRVPGFLHMDLKCENIALSPWPKDIQQDRIDGLVVPKQKYWPVLIDFGLSRTDAVPQDYQDSSSQWGGQCYFQGFDVYRILADLTLSDRPAIANFGSQTLQKIFRGTPEELLLLQNKVHTISEQSMLSAKGCLLALKKMPSQREMSQYLKKELQN